MSNTSRAWHPADGFTDHWYGHVDYIQDLQEANATGQSIFACEFTLPFGVTYLCCTDEYTELTECAEFAW